MKRSAICIVTPGALGSTPRVVKEAQALHDAGYHVTTITTRTDEVWEMLDEGVLAAAPWRTIRLDYRKRIFRLAGRAAQIANSKLFAASGWNHFAQGALSPIVGRLVYAAKNVKADLYIAHYPGALPAAAMAAGQHGASFAFDAEDFHLGELTAAPENAIKKRMLRAVEEHYLPKCAYVTAASPGIADAYRAAYKIPRPKVILNVFPRSQAPSAPTPKGTMEPGPSVYWFSQTIGPDRGLECVVRAIGLTRSKPHLYLRGKLARGYFEHLNALALELGVTHRLHILAPEHPSKMERIAMNFDIGFSGEPGHTPNNKIALGNKLFTYLLAGIPIVLSDIPAHRIFADEIQSAARIYPAGEAHSLAEILDGLLEDTSVLSASRLRAYELGHQRFNWDSESRSLVGLVAQVAGSPLIEMNKDLPMHLQQKMADSC